MNFLTTRSILLSELLDSDELTKDIYNYVWEPPMQKDQILSAKTIMDRLQKLGGSDHCTYALEYGSTLILIESELYFDRIPLESILVILD
jgi:hypothetical protein